MTDMPAMFIADSPGLDFLNSIATPVDVAVDWLASGEGLLDWLRQASLVEPAILEGLRKSAVPGDLDAIAGQARALRDWFRGFVVAHKGAPVRTAALVEIEPLNRLLGRDEQYLEIGVRPAADDGVAPNPFVLERRRRWSSPEALLLPIATAMADTITDEDFTYVKACEGHNCSLLFVDRTRMRRRRWCSMAVCGNRAKQAAHRERRAHQH